MEQIKSGLVGLVIVLTCAILFTIYGKISESGPRSNWEWSDDWNSVELQGNNNSNDNPPINNKPELLKASNFENAKELSAKTNKQILLVVGASWCKWCKQMDTETFSDSSVQAALSNFIVLKINADNDTDGVVKKFKINGLPTCIVTNSNEFKIKSNSGFLNAQDFIKWLGV